MRTVALPLVALALLAGSPLALSALQGGGDMTAEERRAAREAALQEELAQPRPIDALESVWIEELTWMEIRDALAAGKTTAIIPTGGIEQNGPYVATGKHNYVLEAACEELALELGDALCAPIVKLVPEGGIDEPSGHMRYPGTISVRQETFEAMLTDVGKSLEAHGFEHIVYIGDSGGNQRGMANVAERLDAEWTDATAHHIPEFYDYASVEAYMNEELGYVETENDGIHDNFYITAIMMVTDPTVVRYDQRVAAGEATINGLSIAPKEETVEVGRKLLKFRAERTAEAIRAAIGGS